MKKSILVWVIAIAFLFSCSSEDDLFDINAERIPPGIPVSNSFADPGLNQEAKDLHGRLIDMTQKGISFGQQQPFGTGSNFTIQNRLDQDFFEVAGDHLAIAGFDLELLEIQLDGNPNNSFGLNGFINRFTEAVVEAHENGSIITMSWHVTNPNSIRFGGDGSFDNVVSRMLEGGDLRDRYIGFLAAAARLFNNLIDSQGNPIPVLFRPWHEMNGDFFFWGEAFRTTEEYVQLWRDTVTILSEDFNVHNLLYVYAPNWVSNTSEYLRNYPGDGFVDMLGVDVYDFRNGNFLSSALRNLRIIEDIAVEKNMLFALTETGLENVVEDDWWTQSLYKAIRSSGMTYTMVWRNDMTTFFHVPFLGHSSQNDFVEFLDNELILLRSDLQ